MLTFSSLSVSVWAVSIRQHVSLWLPGRLGRRVRWSSVRLWWWTGRYRFLTLEPASVWESSTSGNTSTPSTCSSVLLPLPKNRLHYKSLENSFILFSTYFFLFAYLFLPSSSQPASGVWRHPSQRRPLHLPHPVVGHHQQLPAQVSRCQHLPGQTQRALQTQDWLLQQSQVLH